MEHIGSCKEIKSVIKTIASCKLKLKLKNQLDLSEAVFAIMYYYTKYNDYFYLSAFSATANVSKV